MQGTRAKQPGELCHFVRSGDQLCPGGFSQLTEVVGSRVTDGPEDTSVTPNPCQRIKEMLERRMDLLPRRCRRPLDPRAIGEMSISGLKFFA